MTISSYSHLTAGAAFFLLFAGGLVTSTGSGLAVPDWPLANGQYFPPMKGGILFEHGHRIIAGIVALLTLGLAAWSQRRAVARPVRIFAVIAAGAILVQAVLGGVTVLYGLSKPVSILHACLGQGVFALLVAAAQEAAGPVRGGSEVRSGTSTLGLILIAALFGQLAAGAVLRHFGFGLPWHLLGAAAVVAAAGAVCWRTFGGVAEPLVGPVMVIAGAVPVQLFLGVVALVFRMRERAPGAVIPSLHLAVGALLLGAAVTWTVRARSLERTP